MQALLRIVRAAALAPLHVYRRVISPIIPARCRYYPSCSTYALESIRTYGISRGGVLAAWRLMRCNPLSDGGFDYVEDQKIFRHRHGGKCDHTRGAVAN